MNVDPPHPPVDPSDETPQQDFVADAAAGPSAERIRSHFSASRTESVGEATPTAEPTVSNAPANADNPPDKNIPRIVSFAHLFWKQLISGLTRLGHTHREGDVTQSAFADPSDSAIDSLIQAPTDVSPGDEFTGARAFLKPSPWAITGSDCLKFESLTNQAIRGNYWNFLWWCLGEIVLCLGVFSYVEHDRFLTIVKSYLAILAIGSVALNGNLFFLLFISDRLRKLRPFVEKVTGDTSATSELYQTILYEHSIVYLTVGICIALGYFTFHELGIAGPVPIAKGITMGLFVVFGALGLVIGFVFNVWRFFFKLGPLIKNIDITNPDRMGGLEPIGNVNLWLLYIGAFLIAVYTVGAKYSPYEYIASKEYAYWWTAMAVSLWIIAVFVPTFTIHQVLRSAKREQQDSLAQLKDRLLIGFKEKITETKAAALGLDHIEAYSSSVKSAVDVLRYFEGDLELMTTWPYRNALKTLVNLMSIQAITNVVIHWSDIAKLF